MNTFKHVTNTWLVAQLFYPSVFYIYMGISKRVWEVDVQLITLVIPFSFVFSICSYFLCILFFNLVKSTKLPFNWKFYLWIIMVCFSIPLGIYFTCGFLGDFGFFFEIKFFFIPGIIGAILSILFRYEQFVLTIKNSDLSIQ